MVPAPQGYRGIVPGQRRDARFQPANPAPCDRHHIVVAGVHLDQLIVAGPLVADDAIDSDDVTAMDAHEARIVETTR